MHVAMSGSTGFIGSSLTKVFYEKGWLVTPLAREQFKFENHALAHKLAGCNIVINLAGAPIAARWTEKYKTTLYTSRIHTTRMLVRSFAQVPRKPDLFISASGVGIYGEGKTHMETDQDYAEDFLGRLAFDWEQEALRAESFGVRTVVFRFGVVLGKNGGALQKMLPLFRFGLGGKLGSGKQSFSWVHIHDLIRAFLTAVENQSFRGVYNLTAPNPTTNEGLTRAIAQALGRPALFRIPGFLLKAQFGEGASVLLQGQRVLPIRLLESGFQFKFTTIEEALSDLL